MKFRPFLATYAVAARTALDVSALEEDLPIVLERDPSGFVAIRDTRLTEVNQETTDAA